LKGNELRVPGRILCKLDFAFYPPKIAEIYRASAASTKFL